MKKLITAIAIGAFTFAGTSVKSEARPYEGRGYSAPATTVYVSGYRYGRPVYTQKTFIGYDRCGTPRYSYRTVSAPVRHYGNRYSGYGNHRGHSSYGHPSYGDNYYGGRCDSRRSSGASVSFRFGR